VGWARQPSPRQGWAAKTPHRQCIRRSPIKTSGNDTSYRPPRPRAPSTSSFDRAKRASLVLSRFTGPPPLAPPSQGGETRGLVRAIRATNSGGAQDWCNPNFSPPQGEAPSEPANATAAQQELRPPNNQGHRTRQGGAPAEPATAIAAQQELRPPNNQGHRTREGEAPSEPEGAAARHRRLAFPKSRKPDYHLIRHNNRSSASTDDRLISQSIRWSRSAQAPLVNSTRKLKRAPADCVSDEARPTPLERALPYQLQCRQILIGQRKSSKGTRRSRDRSRRRDAIVGPKYDSLFAP
jgi:hypothetical protein